MTIKQNKRMARKKRKGKGKIVLLILTVFILSTVISAYTFLDKMKSVKISKADEDLGISNKEDKVIKDDKPNPKDDVINIALFGGDKRGKYDPVHSDAIMILSIDKANNTIKLSSIMRDTYVNVYKHGMTKITHAYGYGGPELAIRTLNEDFNLNIRDYAFVDFFGFKDIIDSLDGIDVEVKKYEVNEINKYIREVASIEGKTPTLIKKSGVQHLNGAQALSYSRIRKVGNGDFERTDRQRRVMELLFERVMNAGITQYPKMVDSILPHVETSLSKMDVVKLGTQILSSDIKGIEQNCFPLAENCIGKKIDGIFYIVSDLSETEDEIHKFIYGDIEQCNLN